MGQAALTSFCLSSRPIFYAVRSSFAFLFSGDMAVYIIFHISAYIIRGSFHRSPLLVHSFHQLLLCFSFFTAHIMFLCFQYLPHTFFLFRDEDTHCVRCNTSVRHETALGTTSHENATVVPPCLMYISTWSDVSLVPGIVLLSFPSHLLPNLLLCIFGGKKMVCVINGKKKYFLDGHTDPRQHAKLLYYLGTSLFHILSKRPRRRTFVSLWGN